MSKSKKTAGHPVATSSSVMQSGTATNGHAIVALDPRVAAANVIFEDVASNLSAAVELAELAIGADQPDVLLWALVALLQRTGSLADRAAQACGGGRFQSPDHWVLSARTAEQVAAAESLRGGSIDPPTISLEAAAESLRGEAAARSAS